MRLSRTVASFALIATVALGAVLPMLASGPSCGHDFDFHLLSWLEAAQQMVRGGYPHWAYTPALNAGEPRFLFYPPLSWMLGAVLGLVLPWKLATTAFTWVTLTLAGVTARRLGRRYAPENAATLAAVAYMVNPYMLFTAYERTAYGELLAAAWLPLLFAAALAPDLDVLTLALPVTLLWLTNVPAAVMGMYALAVLMGVRLSLGIAYRKGGKREFASTAVGGTVLGIALAAFYLLPAAMERKFVQADLATGLGMRVVDSTLFHHMAAVNGYSAADAVVHDAVLLTASRIALGLLLAVVAMGAALLLKRKRIFATTAVLVLALLIAFLMTPLSLALWPHLPELQFLQFPWRMCALLAAAAALFLAQLLPGKLSTGRMLAVAAIVLGVSVWPAWTHFRQSCDDEDSVAGRVALFHSDSGTEALDEYTPVGADNDDAGHDPPYWSYCLTGAGEDVAPPANAEPGQAPQTLTVTLGCPSLLVLNRRQYPAWQVLVNGKAVAPHAPERQDGLIAVALPAGTNRVELRLVRTGDRTEGIGISLLAGAAAAGFALRRRKRVSS